METSNNILSLEIDNIFIYIPNNKNNDVQPTTIITSIINYLAIMSNSNNRCIRISNSRGNMISEHEG